MKNILLFPITLFLIVLLSCKEDEDHEEAIIEPSIEFNLSHEAKIYKSASNPFNPTVVLPNSENSESKIVSYIKSNSFELDDELKESINIQLHYTTDIINATPNWNSLLLNGAKENKATYIIDQQNFLGFGITLELEYADDTKWYSYSHETIKANQDGSEFDIYEVLELDTATYIKANLNCKLFNNSDETITLDSGDLTFRLK